VRPGTGRWIDPLGWAAPPGSLPYIWGEHITVYVFSMAGNDGMRDLRRAPTPADSEVITRVWRFGVQAKTAASVGLFACSCGAPDNAVYDAVGVRIHDLPITPEKVLAALKRKRER